MTDLPKFPAIEADRILRRAAEIEGSEDGRELTLAELRSVAREAGFGAHAVERAIGEAQEASRLEVARHPVRRTGIVVSRLSTLRSLPFELTSEQLTTAIRLFQPYRDGPAGVQLGEQRITWRDRKGIGFTITSGHGVTEIRVNLAKVLIRKGRWMGWVKTAADGLESILCLVHERRNPTRSTTPETLLLENRP